MTIWFNSPPLENLNQTDYKNLNTHIGLEMIEAGDDFLKGKMPVDERTRQPGGVLHGGASVVLAETLASWAATFTVDRTKHYCVGQEINANHIRSVKSGWVYGTAKPLHLGRQSQVWEVKIVDENNKLVCVSRVTMAVLSKPSEYHAIN